MPSRTAVDLSALGGCTALVALDPTADGLQFAVGCDDPVVRTYDLRMCSPSAVTAACRGPPTPRQSSNTFRANCCPRVAVAVARTAGWLRRQRRRLLRNRPPRHQHAWCGPLPLPVGPPRTERLHRLRPWRPDVRGSGGGRAGRGRGRHRQRRHLRGEGSSREMPSPEMASPSLPGNRPHPRVPRQPQCWD